MNYHNESDENQAAILPAALMAVACLSLFGYGVWTFLDIGQALPSAVEDTTQKLSDKEIQTKDCLTAIHTQYVARTKNNDTMVYRFRECAGGATFFGKCSADYTDFEYHISASDPMRTRVVLRATVVDEGLSYGAVFRGAEILPVHRGIIEKIAACERREP